MPRVLHPGTQPSFGRPQWIQLQKSHDARGGIFGACCNEVYNFVARCDLDAFITNLENWKDVVVFILLGDSVNKVGLIFS